MGILQVSQTVVAPAAKAFTGYADLEGWKTWSPYVLAVKKITDGPLGIGSKFQIDNKGAGKMEMEIIQFEPPQRLKFRGVGSMVEMTHAYAFSEANGITTIEHVIETRMKGLGILMIPFMGKMMKDRVSTNNEAFKKFIES